MASATGNSTVLRSTAGFPLNKLLISERLKKRRLIRTDVDSRQPLVGTYPRALDETDRLPRKLRVHLHSVVFAVFSALAYIFDFGTDIFVAVSQFMQCRVVEGTLVLVFAFVPSIFVNTLGFLWVTDDLKSRPQHRVTNRFKKSVWVVGILTQTVPALYSIESAYYYCKFRQLLAANNGVIDARILELYYWILESDRDSTLLRVFIAFMESAPQLLLQAYVLCKYVIVGNHHAPTSLFAWVHYVSMASSLFGLSWSLMSQHRCLRYVRQDKENLGIGQCILVFLWRALTLVGRFIALLLFALKFKYWLALLLSGHYLLVLIILCCCEKPKLADTGLQQRLLLFGVAWVHLFCPWNVAEGRTRYRYVWRYGLEWLEFVAVVLTLYFSSGKFLSLSEYVLIIVAACSYAAGLFVMCAYYSCCHPNSTLGRRHYPPLVVVYSPPEKVPTVLPVGDPNISPAPVIIPVTEPSAAIIRRRDHRASLEDGDVGCCGGGAGASVRSAGNASIRSGGGGGSGGCDGGWGGTADGGSHRDASIRSTGGSNASVRNDDQGGGGGYDDGGGGHDDGGGGCDTGGGGGDTGGDGGCGDTGGGDGGGTD